MPACIARVPCDVSWLPSLGRITSASTFWLIRVSIAAICWVMSLVGFTGANVTSGYFAAWAWAFAAMAAIQPWSAAGAEKPIVTGPARLRRSGRRPVRALGGGGRGGRRGVARARRQRGAGADGEGTGEEAAAAEGADGVGRIGHRRPPCTRG